MKNQETIERRRVMLLLSFSVFWGLVTRLLIIRLVKGDQTIGEILLFIPAGVLVAIAASLVVLPMAAEKIVSRVLTARRAKLGIGAAILFVALIIPSEIFLLWPIAYKYLYYDLFPIALGFACVTFLVGVYRLATVGKGEASLPTGLGSLSTLCALFLTIGYLLTTNFSFVRWWILVPAGICLFYCAKISCDVAAALIIFAVKGRC